MVKNDGEINSLGQLVVSMTREILDTSRVLLSHEYEQYSYIAPSAPHKSLESSILCIWQTS